MPTTNVSVRPVTQLVFETKCHNDELVARFLGTEFGGDIFPGFSKAYSTFSLNCARQTPEYWAKRGIFCIGCGGDITDEHTNGAQDRQKDTCSATLMAELLGIKVDPAVARITKETLLFDAGDGCPRGHLAEFVKAVHRRMPGGELALTKWHNWWLKAVYNRLTLEPTPRGKEKTLSERVEKIMSQDVETFSDERIRSRIIQDTRTIEGMGNRYVLGLPFILQSLERTNMADKDINESLHFFVGIMYREQEAFMALHKQAEEKVRRYRVSAVLDGRDRDLCLMVFTTDDELALKVLLSMGADIALIVSTNGHPAIFRNKKRVPGLCLNTARGMIRWLELEKNENGQPITSVPFEELESFEGTHPLVPQWYAVNYMIANGTTTHRGVSRTRMVADATPRSVLVNAFHPRRIEDWKRDRGIPISLHNPVVKDKEVA